LTLLPFQSLFNENSCGDQLLGSPHFSGVLTHPVPCLLIWWGFFWGEGRVSLSRGLCCFIPGVAVGIPCEAYLLTCWFAGCLPNRFGASILLHQSPPVFSVQRGMEKLCAGWEFRVLMFRFFLVLFSAKCGSSISAKFLIYGAHAVCFYTLVTILDPRGFFVLF
jgi:hypothetical protein